MGKEELFSRLNIKNYNNELEKILDNKSFSEGTKNLLLSMLYKVEIAYSDYNKVKVDTMSKRETIEQIIKIVEEDCNQIEVVKPSIEKETVLKDKKYVIIEKDKKIIVYPNEHMLLYALFLISKEKYTVRKEYNIVKNSVEEMLNTGYQINKSEIIRDFDRVELVNSNRRNTKQNI